MWGIIGAGGIVEGVTDLEAGRRFREGGGSELMGVYGGGDARGGMLCRLRRCDLLARRSLCVGGDEVQDFGHSANHVLEQNLAKYLE